MWNAKQLLRAMCSLLLLTTATTVLVSGATYNGNQYWHSPTKTYQGYFAMEYYGIYRYVTEIPLCRQALLPCLSGDRMVLYLETDTGFLVHLTFYCSLGYCNEPNQIRLEVGTRVHVKGTLIEPSQWSTSEYEPNLYFVGDLYVFQYGKL